LDLEPLLNGVLALSEESDLVQDSLLERLDESHGVPLIELHDRLFKLLLNFNDVCSENSWQFFVSKFAASNYELSSLHWGHHT
jgi:hypothetical protein